MTHRSSCYVIPPKLPSWNSGTGSRDRRMQNLQNSDHQNIIIQPTTLSERNSQILGDSLSFSLPINPIVYGKLGLFYFAWLFLMGRYMAKRWIFPQVCELWFGSSCGLIAMEIGYALLLLLGPGVFLYIQSSYSKLARHSIEKLPFGRCMFYWKREL